MKQKLVIEIDDVWFNDELRMSPQKKKHNMRVVRWLYFLCSQFTFYKGVKVKDTYYNIPYHYTVWGVKVSFLPHWGQIEIAELKTRVPKSFIGLCVLILGIKMLGIESA